ncbi:hypothetical protein FACS189461_1010 [Spirochaetia bacterium]|nr:hypothetical protein FACS189461_1010 [Spirochaetia bacterium]
MYYLAHSTILQLLWGNGLSAASTDVSLYGKMYGDIGNLYIVNKVIDIGFIGFGLEIVFFLVCLNLTKNKLMYIFLPFLIAGFSMCPSNLSYFYTLIGITIGIERNSTR